MRIRVCIGMILLGMSFSAQAQNDVPDWAEGAVWYHIVVDRFRNGNPNNDPVKKEVVGDRAADWQIHPWASDWYKRQVWETSRQQDFHKLVRDRRYGGDLLGVLEGLQYLQNLGVDVICLSPVFEAPSAFKYDFATLHHVDNNFGSNPREDLKNISKEKESASDWKWTSADRQLADVVLQAHELDMKVVLEVAFNYCGRDFWAFKDVIENQQQSRYKDWFVIHAWDDPATPDTVEFDYASWQNDDNFPLFRHDENGLVPPVREYIFDSTRRWMELKTAQNDHAPIDGWYVKNVDEVAIPFWRDWLALVREINSEAAVVSEAITPALGGVSYPRFDGITNYPLMSLIHDFFVENALELTVSEFDRRLSELRRDHPRSHRNAMITPIDDLQTGRIASLLRNAARDRMHFVASGFTHGYEKKIKVDVYDPRPPGEEQRRVQKLLTLFQMTYIGSPLINYGSENGMWGAGPDAFKPMLWPAIVYEDESYASFKSVRDERARNRFNNDLFRFYRKLIEIRRHHGALRHGSVRKFLVDDAQKLYAFSRQYKQDEVLVILNTDDREHTLTIASPWYSASKVQDVLNDKTYHVNDNSITVSLKAKTGLILAKR